MYVLEMTIKSLFIGPICLTNVRSRGRLPSAPGITTQECEAGSLSMPSLLNEKEIEEAITSPDCNWNSVARGLAALYKAGKAAEAQELADSAETALKSAGKTDDLLKILAVKAAAGGKPTDGASWLEQVQQILGSEWEQKTLIEQACFDTGISDGEALRRLIVLRALKEGAVCYDKTWGTGVIGKIDFFYKRVDIDFKKKRGHQLALSYAAEKLLLIDETHILYWRHQKPAELEALVKENPGQAVKMALTSFGPMSAIQLQEKLVPEIVDEKKWKGFWESARKQLKNDKAVTVPPKKTDVMRVIEVTEGDDYDDMNGLAAERNLETLTAAFEEYAEEIGSGGVTEQQRGILQDRLAFVVKGAWPRQLALLIRTKIAAASLGVDDETKPELAATEKFLDPEIFVETLKNLPVKHSGLFLRYLAAYDKSRVEDLMVNLLSHLDTGSMSEVINYLIDTQQEKRAADLFRAAIESREPGVEILSWLSRNMEKTAAWGLGSMNQILNFMVDEIEKDYSGDQLKAQNQLKDRFSKSDWMGSALGQVEPEQREAFTMRIKNSSGWSALDRQSQLAIIVKLFPELEKLMAASSRETESKPKGPLTSIRTYEERKEQLQRIVNFEIPKVAKEIALAREYGDLRENFEYKAAKDAQALLFRRRDEMAAMLSKVSPTDFKDLPTDKAGPATAVELTYGDGRNETFYLLGEWDSDPTLGIISSNSRMAQVLSGHTEGEHIMVPTEHGEATCTITAIKPLPDRIRLWIERKA